MSSSARPAGKLVRTGDAVNVADRLEKAAEPGEVLTGERTAAAAAGAFDFSAPRTVEAKGSREAWWRTASSVRCGRCGHGA